MSRVHPGKSKGFKVLKAIRNKRKIPLEQLRIAQQAYRRIYSCPDIKNILMNRQKLIAIKDVAIRENIQEDTLDNVEKVVQIFLFNSS